MTRALTNSRRQGLVLGASKQSRSDPAAINTLKRFHQDSSGWRAAATDSRTTATGPPKKMWRFGRGGVGPPRFGGAPPGPVGTGPPTSTRFRQPAGSAIRLVGRVAPTRRQGAGSLSGKDDPYCSHRRAQFTPRLLDQAGHDTLTHRSRRS